MLRSTMMHSPATQYLCDVTRWQFYKSCGGSKGPIRTREGMDIVMDPRGTAGSNWSAAPPAGAAGRVSKSMENGGYMPQEKLSFFALNVIVLLLTVLGVWIVRSTLIREHNHPSYDLGL